MAYSNCCFGVDCSRVMLTPLAGRSGYPRGTCTTARCWHLQTGHCWAQSSSPTGSSSRRIASSSAAAAPLRRPQRRWQQQVAVKPAVTHQAVTQDVKLQSTAARSITRWGVCLIVQAVASSSPPGIQHLAWSSCSDRPLSTHALVCSAAWTAAWSALQACTGTPPQVGDLPHCCIHHRSLTCEL
jgi:hypothetical protein